MRRILALILVVFLCVPGALAAQGAFAARAGSVLSDLTQEEALKLSVAWSGVTADANVQLEGDDLYYQLATGGSIPVYGYVGMERALLSADGQIYRVRYSDFQPQSQVSLLDEDFEHLSDIANWLLRRVGSGCVSMTDSTIAIRVSAAELAVAVDGAVSTLLAGEYDGQWLGAFLERFQLGSLSGLLANWQGLDVVGLLRSSPFADALFTATISRDRSALPCIMVHASLSIGGQSASVSLLNITTLGVRTRGYKGEGTITGLGSKPWKISYTYDDGNLDADLKSSEGQTMFRLYGHIGETTSLQLTDGGQNGFAATMMLATGEEPTFSASVQEEETTGSCYLRIGRQSQSADFSLQSWRESKAFTFSASEGQGGLERLHCQYTESSYGRVETQRAVDYSDGVLSFRSDDWQGEITATEDGAGSLVVEAVVRSDEETHRGVLTITPDTEGRAIDLTVMADGALLGRASLTVGERVPALRIDESACVDITPDMLRQLTGIR